MDKTDEICSIVWTKEDVVRVLQDAGKPSSDEDVAKFIASFNWRQFEEKLIQEGFEMMNYDL